MTQTSPQERAEDTFFIEVSVPGMELWPQLRDRARSLRENGIKVLFLCAAEFAHVYADCSDAIAVCPDIYDTDAVVEALTPYRGRLERFSLLSDKIWPVQLEAARRLGMSFNGLEGQLNCRIKPRMRAVLADQLPLRTRVLAASELSPETAAEVVAELGVPFVIKPIWGAASAFVDVVTDAGRAYDALAETFAAVATDHAHGSFDDGSRVWNPRAELLLEQYIGMGRELSFEAFIQDGELVPLLIQEKLFMVDEGGFPMETANVCPTPFVSPAEQDRIRDILQATLTKLGVDDTFVHIECKWDGSRLALIEINPRIGGGSVSKVLTEWLGVDARRMGLALQTGERLPRAYERRRDGFLLGVFVNADEGGVFKEFEGLEWVHEQPGFSFEQAYVAPGTRIPARGESAGTREAWMYIYDAFYHCFDLDQVDYLHDQTRKRVKLVFEKAA